MNSIDRLAIIGNALPRRCGIATFTTDLHQALADSPGVLEAAIVAMNDNGRTYPYPAFVRRQINDDAEMDYVSAAKFLNEGDYQAVSLQHEFGIFGGNAGSHVQKLLSRIRAPVITTLHTLLSVPSRAQLEALDSVIAASSHLIVMSKMGRDILRRVHGVARDRISIIPHGIPAAPFVDPTAAKQRLGFSGKTVILTFGLLSPNKGIEVMIDAMPSILAVQPEAVYVVLGATHPNLLRQAGEAYRESLVARVQALGISRHVIFLDQFVDQATLIEFITMCDVYVTPYLNEAQMTSGTLAYSFGLGKPVVSTPYWHAKELLADGRGVLVPFNDSAAIGAEIARLLGDDDLRLRLQMLAYESSRSMTWDKAAERYLQVFDDARRVRPIHSSVPARGLGFGADLEPPQLRLSHFLSMCDDTGLLQHAVLSVADRSHGYCVDDNARALLVACAMNRLGDARVPEALIARFAAFVQHAWNPIAGRFRNFMSFDRRWLEQTGSEDSHGRALWAMGECARGDVDASRRRWAASLFLEALPAVAGFTSPRAWSFALLGLNAFCGSSREDDAACSLRRELADRLIGLLSITGTAEWVWFESELAYDNARLPQALISVGARIGEPSYVDAGIKTLRWLMNLQTSRSGVFRPVGSDSFGLQRTLPEPFDQQPLEATASMSACLAAWQCSGDARWKTDAKRSFDWFLGDNDLHTSLIDRATGSCRDGLHPDRPNENQGAESVISYLLAFAESRVLAAELADLPASALNAQGLYA